VSLYTDVPYADEPKKMTIHLSLDIAQNVKAILSTVQITYIHILMWNK